MRLGDVNFPDDLIEAARVGSLVVFAGAGVSVGPPSNLPKFDGLADQIAQGTGQQRDKEGKEPIDRFLGRLDSDGVDVHSRTADILLVPDSHLCPIHQDLLRIFGKENLVRVVTTNFDLHFDAAARETLGSAPRTYTAPALPVGDKWQGIVYLHGSLHNCAEMVLTDSDFGRAYLTEGWARRFLVALFQKFHVLFVGYSHEDPVMNYLARALPPSSSRHRYVLTTESNTNNWDLLEIQAIRYRDEDDSHSSAKAAIQVWADHASRRPSDWLPILAKIATDEPPIDAEGEDGVKNALREPYKQRVLLDHMISPDWVRWFRKHGLLEPLFLPGTLPPAEENMAYWLAKTFASSHAEVLFGLIAEHQMRVNPVLWRQIAGALFDKPPEGQVVPADVWPRWATVLLATAPNQEDSALSFLPSLAGKCAEHRLWKPIVELFIFLASPRIHFEKAFALQPDPEGSEGRFYAKTVLRESDLYGLDTIWNKHLKPYLSEVAEPLLLDLVRVMQQAHNLETAWHTPFDSLSFSRRSIEPSSQSGNYDASDVVVDAARDCLEWLADKQQDHGDSWIRLCLSSGISTLRRLAIHTVTCRKGTPPKRTLDWILEQELLGDIALHHEVFHLLEQTYHTADDASRAAFIGVVEDGGWASAGLETQPDLVDRRRYDLLSWLADTSPECPHARRALGAVQGRHPAFVPDKHVAFTHWMEGGIKGISSPWSVEALLDRPAADWVPDLVGFRRETFDGPDEIGLGWAVGEAARSRPEWGLALAEALANSGAWSSLIWGALQNAWCEADFDENSWGAVLDLLSRTGLQDNLQGYDHHAARLLVSLSNSKAVDVVGECFERAKALAGQVWGRLSPEVPQDANRSWHDEVFESTPGLLVDFWVRCIDRETERSPEPSIPAGPRQVLGCVLADMTPRGRVGAVVVARYTRYLYRLDPEWAKAQLVPLFADTRDSERWLHLWRGFLAGGTPGRDLYVDMQDGYLAAARHFGAIGSCEDESIGHLVNVLALYGDDPMSQLLPLLFENGGPSLPAKFTGKVGMLLRKMDETARRELWERWLRNYWRDRNQGVPRHRVDADETRALLRWVVHLKFAMPAIANLVATGAYTLSYNLWGLEEFVENGVVTDFPYDTARFLEATTRGEVESFWARDLSRLMHCLEEAHVQRQILDKIRDNLAQSGIALWQYESQEVSQSGNAAKAAVPPITPIQESPSSDQPPC